MELNHLWCSSLQLVTLALTRTICLGIGFGPLTLHSGILVGRRALFLAGPGELLFPGLAGPHMARQESPPCPSWPT